MGGHLIILGVISVVLTGRVGGEISEFASNKMPKCQPITIEMCKDLPYQLTSYPNFVGYDEQAAKEELDHYTPLIQTHQNFDKLKFFLCSVYVPMCTEKVPQAIGPCRPLCEEVRATARPTLQHFGYDWPSSLNCSKFPMDNNQETMCMVGPASARKPDFTDPPEIPGRPDKDLPDWANPNSLGVTTPCPSAMYPNSHQLYVNRSAVCALQCDRNARQPFTVEQRNNVTTVAFCLSLMSVVMALVCCVVLVCRRRRVKSTYPHNCLLLITFCMACYSSTAMLSLMWSTTVSCVQEGAFRVYATANLSNVSCSVTAILMYYFTTAAKIWWVHLCVTWLCHGTLGWSNKRIQTHRFALHMMAWGVPLIAVVSVLLVNAVDGDPLTTMCSVGKQSSSAHMAFILVRELVILCIGGQALVFGTIHNLCQRHTVNTAAAQLAREQSASMISTTATKPHNVMQNGTYTTGQSCASSLMTALPHSMVNVTHWRLGLIAWAYVPVSIALCIMYMVDGNKYASEIVGIVFEGGYALAIQACCCAWLLFAAGTPSSQTLQRKQVPPSTLQMPTLPRAPPPTQYTPHHHMMTQYRDDAQSPVYHQYGQYARQI